MEKLYEAIYNELFRSEITMSTDTYSENTVLYYNRFNDHQDYFFYLDKVISPFMTALYKINQSPSHQFSVYNELLRRWHSLNPFFILSPIGEIIGHRNLNHPISIPDEIKNTFIESFLVIQHNTYKKIETELNHKIEFLKIHHDSQERIGPQFVVPDVKTKKYNNSYTRNSFKFKDEKQIRLFFKILREKGYIKNNDFKTFDNNFSGEIVRSKIFWASSKERLNYIIKLLKDNNVIEDYKRAKNDLIVRCFCDEKGNDYNTEQFSAIHYPKDIDKIDGYLDFLWDTE